MWFKMNYINMQHLAFVLSLNEITMVHLNIQCVYQINQNVVNKTEIFLDFNYFVVNKPDSFSDLQLFYLLVYISNTFGSQNQRIPFYFVTLNLF